MNDSTNTADAAKSVELVEQSLYEVRKKIYSRAVSGWFAGWRVALVLLTQLVYYGSIASKYFEPSGALGFT